MNPHKKQKDARLTAELLQARAERSIKAGFTKQKWVEFCETLMADGYRLNLYEARTTFSKYITVRRKGAKPFKVRFSNHKPIMRRELEGDCDFFVGVTNLGVTTTQDALKVVKEHFSKERDKHDHTTRPGFRNDRPQP